MNSDMSNDAMTAADRRNAWFTDRLTGADSLDWSYGSWLVDLLSSRFELIEMIVGIETASAPLRALVDGPDASADTWRAALDEAKPELTLDWGIARRLDEAGTYGLYGVTPADIPLPEREGWIEDLLMEVEAFHDLARIPEKDSAVSRIVRLARARRNIETGRGEIDVPSLAILGGVSEGRLRNLMSGATPDREKSGSNVSAVSALAWLRGRKEFFSSIWHRDEGAGDTEPGNESPLELDQIIFVPVAADGSFFRPDLKRAGGYTIGSKGAEFQRETFEEALAELMRMPTPRWRRPNETGNWGIVAGREWKRVDRKALL